MNKDSFIITQFILVISGILATLWLVGNEIIQGDYCPKLFGSPACYLVLAAFFLVLIAMFIGNKKYNRLLYGLGATLGLFIAIWFSINQIFNLKECPKWFGLPLCYLSLLTFGALIWLKIHIIKKKTDGYLFAKLK